MFYHILRKISHELTERLKSDIIAVSNSASLSAAFLVIDDDMFISLFRVST